MVPLRDILPDPVEVVFKAFGIDIDSNNHMGFCGGMCWASLDRFRSNQLIPATSTTPTSGSPLYDEILQRQMDTLLESGELDKVLIWTTKPDVDIPRWPWVWSSFFGKSLTYLTRKKEWPKVKGHIDRGMPVILCLIRTNDLFKVTENHQVLAIGYREESEWIYIKIYDPNRPKNDDVWLKISRAGDNRNWESYSSRISEKCRGFFIIKYDRE